MISLFLAIFVILFGFLLIRKINKGPSNKQSSKSQCVICEEILNDEEMFDQDGLALCGEHNILYQSNEWFKAITVKSNPDDIEGGVRLYELRQKLYIQGIPSFIKADYQMQGKDIQTILILFARQEDLDKINNQFSHQ